MEESYRKGLADHPDPESCVASRKAAIEALIGAPAGRVLSCEIFAFGVPTLFNKAEGNIKGRAFASAPRTPRSLRPQACWELHAREPRDPIDARTCTGRSEKATSQKSDMHVGGKSDGRVLPSKCPNNSGQPLAEDMEGAADQGKHRADDRAPDSEPDKRVERLARCAGGST